MAFNREPSLLFCSIAALIVKVIEGFTLRINSSICVLFNKSVLKYSRLHCRLDLIPITINSVNRSPCIRVYNRLVLIINQGDKTKLREVPKAIDTAYLQ